MPNPETQKLQDLQESEFRDLLVILLRNMGLESVQLNHGANEFGKDIVFRESGKVGVTYFAVIAKTGDISGSNDGSPRLTNVLRNINNQISVAFDVPYEDVTSDDSPKHRINEVIVWTSGKISGNAEKQIIESLDHRYRHARFRDGNATVELLQQHFPSYFSIDDKDIADYFDRAKARHGTMEERYSLILSDSSGRLPSTFVAPRLEILSEKTSNEVNRLRNRRSIPFGRLVSMTSNTAILGDMGSGKSTLLRRLLLNTIASNQKTAQKFPIPVLLNFKDLNLKDARPLEVSREIVIENAIQQELNTICGRTVERDLALDLTQGNITLLIDGLDELDGMEAIQCVMGVTKTFADRYPNCRIIITSRMELLNQGNYFAGFKMYKLEEFTIKEIRQLVIGWFGQNSPDSRKLLRLVITPMTMYSIPCTPLALTIIAVLFQSGKRDMPSNLTDLLQMYVELALGRWDQRRNYSSQPNWSYKEQVLQKLSWHMICKGLGEITTSFLRDFAEEYKYDYASTFDSDALVKDILERSGLLIRNENAELEFKHRTFLDYFSGKELNSQRNAAEFLVDRFGDPNWSKAIFFACGLLPHNEIYLEGIVDKIPSYDVDLVSYAFDMGFIAQAARHVNRSTKRKIVRRSLQAFVEAWNSFAQVFLSPASGNQRDTFLPYPYAALFHSILVGISVGSPTLAPALEDIANELLEFMVRNPSLTESRRQRLELMLFLLAVACAKAGNVDSFVRIFEQNRISNPVLVMVGELEVRKLRSEDTLTDLQKNSTTNLAKKLKRKLSNNNDYLRESFKRPPILLEETVDSRSNVDWDWLLGSGETHSSAK